MRKFKVTIEVAVRDPQAVMEAARETHPDPDDWNQLIDDGYALEEAVHDLVLFCKWGDELDFYCSEIEENGSLPEDWPRRQLEVMRAW